MKDFKKEYITAELHSGSGIISGAYGVCENIKTQWDNKSKAMGMFNNETYLFGATTEFANDHVYIIDEMEKILGKARFMFSVDESGGKVTVWIRPAHTGIVPEGEFEKQVIQGVLKECLEAFSVRPEGTEMRVDIEPELLDTDDVLMTRSKDIVGLENQINHLLKP